MLTPAVSYTACPERRYLMLTKVPLTFLIFIGRADPVPKKTTSGYFPP